MNAHVWTKMALASALLVGGMSAQAQTSSGGVGTAGQGAVGQQTRPAPVTGKVSNDPAAVALRPATQAPAPVTSKATQVAPPANPNEPLFSSAAETSGHAAAATPAAAPKTAESAKQRQPHTDRTEGVKKRSKTTPQPHDKKVSGKPRQTAKGPGKDAAKDEGATGSKGSKDAHKGKKKSDKQPAASSTVKAAHAAKADAGKKAVKSSAHQTSHQKKSAKAHDKAVVAHAATAGKRPSDKAGHQAAPKLVSSAEAGKAGRKALKKTASKTDQMGTQKGTQKANPKADQKAHHAKAAHAAPHKTSHGQQPVVAKAAAAKASSPSAKKPAKAARAHKAAA